MSPRGQCIPTKKLLSKVAFLFLGYVQNKKNSWARWCTPIIPALGRLRQEDHEFKASLGYTQKPCLKKRKKPTYALSTILQ
jgi:hypothetical protein